MEQTKSFFNGLQDNDYSLAKKALYDGVKQTLENKIEDAKQAIRDNYSDEVLEEEK